MDFNMDFSKVTNFFSDLLGNPFSTPVGQLIGIFQTSFHDLIGYFCVVQLTSVAVG